MAGRGGRKPRAADRVTAPTNEGISTMSENAETLDQSDQAILSFEVSDEALEAASGLADRPNLPCTSPPCLASTFCENKC